MHIHTLQDVLDLCGVEAPYRNMLFLRRVGCAPGSIVIPCASLSSCFITVVRVALRSLATGSAPPSEEGNNS